MRTGTSPEPPYARIGGIAAVALLALLGGLVAAPNARADGDAGAAVPAAPAAAGQPQGAVEPAPPAAAVPPPADQAATTAQDAAADAIAAQPEQPNVVVIVRINSPGDDVIAQTNTITVDSSVSNRSTTTQAEAPAAALLLSRPARLARAARPAAATAQPRPSAQVAAAPAEPTPATAAADAAPHSSAPPPVPAAQRKTAAAPRNTQQRSAPLAAAAPRSPAAPTQAVTRAGQAPAPSTAAPEQPSAATPGIAHRLLALADPLRRVDAVMPTETAAAGEPGFVLAALAALAAGLLGWAALVWLPHRRRLTWSARG